MKSERRLRIGVLGLGSAGTRHAAAAVACKATELVAVADNSPTVRMRFHESEYAVVGTLEELIDASPEVVIVALPHAALAEACRNILASGLHVLLEKPMARSSAEARTIVEQAESAGLRVMVNYNHRFREEYQVAKRFLDEGRIGRPTLFLEQMFFGASPLPDWVWKREVAGGGMMTYNGAHGLDHLVWLSGSKIETIEALTDRFHYSRELEDTAVATLRFADGAIGSLVQQKSKAKNTLRYWETLIHGTQGALRIRSGVGLELSSQQGDATIETGEGNRFVGALEELAAALREGRNPQPDGRSSLHVLACLEALYRSSSQGSGSRVRVDG